MKLPTTPPHDLVWHPTLQRVVRIPVGSCECGWNAWVNEPLEAPTDVSLEESIRAALEGSRA